MIRRRLEMLAVADLVVLAIGVIVPGAIGWMLVSHAGVALLGYATWLREGGAGGFAPAILGVAGPVAILATRRLAWRGEVEAVDADAVFGVPAERHAHRGASLAVARMLDGRVLHAAPEAMSSFVTIMRHGDVAERRQALETVVRSFQPALSPLIALALTDADQTIRALAAAASARVVQNLGLARAALETRDDAAGRGALAGLLADHARANVLLSDSQRGHLRDDAVALYGAGEGETARVEALWAAGDYAALDRLAAASPDGAALAWWRTAAA